MTADPALAALVERVREARDAKRPLAIRGGGSKSFYGEAERGEPLAVTALAGVSNYEPTELVVSARCGTPLAELEAVLDGAGQCLPFEPPHFGPCATVGGMVAAGLAGPARAARGGVRDYLLGATLLTGRAELLSFGGQVMKNVAGYDIARVAAGSMGTLGIICEVSLKLLPRPRASLTLRHEVGAAAAIERLNAWAARPLPIDASAWWEGVLVLRLSGAAAAVEAARAALGGEAIEPEAAQDFWSGLREQHDEYFDQARRACDADASMRLWRLSLPPTTPPLALEGATLFEWGGAQRWLATDLPPARVRDAAVAAGGHATIFRGQDKSAGVFTPPAPALARIQRELKLAFDPLGIFNPGRLGE